MTSKRDLQLDNKDILHQKVCNVLREAILKGILKPGERLKQSELAEELGVSRMPIREALRVLETEGLILLEPHKGAIVKSISKEDFKEIYALRSVLESLAVEKSVLYMTNKEIEELKTFVDIMENTEQIEEFIMYNNEFHKLLIKHCQWDRLNSFVQILWNGFPQQTPRFLEGQKTLSNKEHRLILEAVIARDALKAGSLMAGHIQRTGNKLVEDIESEV